MIRGPQLVLCFLAVGCLATRTATKDLKTQDAMRSSVNASVPAGTSVRDAITFMESEGFECSVCRNEMFTERPSWHESGETYEGIDFIRCRRQNSAGFLMTRNWNVAILLDGDETGGVLVAHGIHGP